MADTTRRPNRIRELREAQGLSQQALAVRCSTSQATIDRLEKGDRQLTVDWMRNIAKALQVTPADLISSPTVSEFAEDAEAYIPQGEARVTTALRSRALGFFRVKSDVLVSLGIKPGDVRLFDMSQGAVDGVKTGDVVVAQVYDPDPQVLEGTVTVVRQFVAPALLTTNRPTTNVAFTLVNPNFEAVIKGVMVPDGDESPAN